MYKALGSKDTMEMYWLYREDQREKESFSHGYTEKRDRSHRLQFPSAISLAC